MRTKYLILKNNLLLGCGYGNWKLTAIPYEKSTINELIVSIHVHNDFIETTVETGIIGGLLFFSIFIVLGWFILKPYFQKQHFQLKEIAPVLLTILVCYFVDASLNFPGGRPIMQFYFAFMLALCYNFHLEGGQQPLLHKKVPIEKRVFGCIYLLILIPAFIIQILIYNSLIAQEQFSRDSLKQPPSESWDDVKDAFPAIPNIDVQCLPIGEIKAKYLIKENKYDEALTMLQECSNVNPELGYNDYLKGIVYYKTNRIDSAYTYATLAFHKRPRAIPFCKFLLTICAVKKDKVAADKVFNTVVSLHNDKLLWNHYIEVLSVLNVDNSILISLADSALKIAPDDESLKKTKNELDRIYEYSLNTTARQLFGQKNYPQALIEFKKIVEKAPSLYLTHENIGLCYYCMNDFENAINSFDTAISLRKLNDGKAEFYIGMSNVQLGNKAEGCRYLQISDANNYKEAKKYIDTLCK